MITKTLGWISDAAILAELQSLNTQVQIVGYQTIAGSPVVSWESSPTGEDENVLAAYFQQNNQLRSWV